jgi:hypothetical protein
VPASAVEAVHSLLLATTKAWTSTGPAAEGSRRQAAVAAAETAAIAEEGESEDEEDEEEDDDACEATAHEGADKGSCTSECMTAGGAAAAAAEEVCAAGAVATAAPGRARSAASGSDVIIGMVGHPNVGKSSVINTICAAKRVSVSRTAGHTKRAQTIPVAPGLQLLDCPGLVFPRGLIPRPTPTPDAAERAPPASALPSLAAQADALAAGAGPPGALALQEPAGEPSSVAGHCALERSPIVLPCVMTALERSTAAAARRSSCSSSGASSSAPAASPAATGEAVERAMQQLCGVISLAQVRARSQSRTVT